MSKRVLIVEDDELLREIYATKLEMEGFQVETAKDGLEGLEKASRAKPDIILLDMIMPRMTGLEFLQAFRPASNHPRIATVIMSNKSTVAEINRAKELGALDYLIKSQHTPDQIVERIHTYINR
jgi:DNA-binding response OmpR family regulator